MHVTKESAYGWPVVFGIIGAYPIFNNMTKVCMIRDASLLNEVYDMMLISNIISVFLTTALSFLFSYILSKFDIYVLVFVFFGLVPILAVFLEIRHRILIHVVSASSEGIFPMMHQ